MMDVKKLVIGFLVLAVATSASALLISNLGGSSAAANDAALTADAGLTAQAADPATGNAFLPQPADPNANDVDLFGATTDQTDTSSTDAISNDPNNLTNVLAETYLTDLMSANPTGPQDDGSGNASFTPPDSDTVIAQLAGATSTLASIQAPGWDAEADQVAINVIAASTSSTIANYSAALQSIFNQDFVETNLESMLNQNSDPGAAAYAEPKVQSALQDIAGLQTPQPAVAFQKSLIKMLVYEKNTLALAENDSADPLKTALVFQEESPKYDAVVQTLKTQFQVVSALAGFSPIAQAPIPVPSGPVAFIDNVLGIQTAHAIFGLGDITFNPTAFAQMLKTYAENIILQILKNVIIGLMQKTVLHWVQGNGVPRFIQNWGTTLVNAYTNAAINALNSQFSCANPAYNSQLQVLLKIPTPNSAGGLCAVQFSNALAGNNLTKFYNNFSSGGFVSYMAVFQPSGNLFGSAIDAQDTAMNAGLQSYAAVQTKSIANQGWKGTEVCANSSGPVTDPATGCKLGDILNGNGQCQPTTGAPYAPQGGGGQCANGAEPTTLQSGIVTGQVFNSAIDSSGKLTAAANDVAGLLDAFLSSLLNSIATDVITTTSGAIINSANNSGGGGTTVNTTTGSTSVDLTCTVAPNVPSPGSFVLTAAGGNVISASGSQTTPQYTWTAPAGAIPTTGAGQVFQVVFATPGTYNITLQDTVDNVSTNCPVTY